MRGLIGKKLGMTQVFVPDGGLVCVTVIQTGPCTVVQKKTQQRDGYTALQLGFGTQKPHRVSKPVLGHCQKSGKGPFAVLREFRSDDIEAYEVGGKITVEQVFRPGDLVNVVGRTKGRGFTGVMKRHGMAGFPKSHGTHEYFRHGGAIGNRSKANVWPVVTEMIGSRPYTSELLRFSRMRTSFSFMARSQGREGKLSSYTRRKKGNLWKLR